MFDIVEIKIWAIFEEKKILSVLFRSLSVLNICVILEYDFVLSLLYHKYILAYIKNIVVIFRIASVK